MKLFKVTFVMAAVMWAMLSSASAGDGWLTDFKLAQAKAQQEGKPLLLNFTGTDWCGWCIRLDQEVFSQPDFKAYAEKELVLVELDFPRKGKQSAQIKAQNEALAQKYQVRGFPTILLLSSPGELIEKTGYRKGGAESYVEHIKQILAAR